MFASRASEREKVHCYFLAVNAFDILKPRSISIDYTCQLFVRLHFFVELCQRFALFKLLHHEITIILALMPGGVEKQSICLCYFSINSNNFIHKFRLKIISYSFHHLAVFFFLNEKKTLKNIYRVSSTFIAGITHETIYSQLQIARIHFSKHSHECIQLFIYLSMERTFLFNLRLNNLHKMTKQLDF